MQSVLFCALPRIFHQFLPSQAPREFVVLQDGGSVRFGSLQLFYYHSLPVIFAIDHSIISGIVNKKDTKRSTCSHLLYEVVCKNKIFVELVFRKLALLR